MRHVATLTIFHRRAEGAGLRRAETCVFVSTLVTVLLEGRGSWMGGGGRPTQT